MATTPLNCGTAVIDKFCPHCSREISVGRLTWHHLLEETIHFFTHIEQVFLRTTKELITRPGAMHKNFLEGKRKTYHKPVSFLLIWVAIFLLIVKLTQRFGNFDKETTSSFLGVGLNIEAVILKYRALIDILILPFTAFNGWLLLAYPDQLSRISYNRILQVRRILYFFGGAVQSWIDLRLQPRISNFRLFHCCVFYGVDSLCVL